MADHASEADESTSFFDAITDSDEEATDDGNGRVQHLKRTLFDLAYLVMNADGTEHISEKMLVRKLEDRMQKEGSVDVEERADELQSLLEAGPGAIRDRVEELADEFADLAGDQTEALGGSYLELLKGLIVADANVAPKEYEVFQLLCDRWGVENELPQP